MKSDTKVSGTKGISGSKYDKNKPRMDLLDPDALEGLSRVLSFGAEKYDPYNWQLGIVNSRLIASLLRHLSAIQRGEDIDPESGEPHINHLGCNWMFLSWNYKHRPDLDDRPKRLGNANQISQLNGNTHSATMALKEQTNGLSNRKSNDPVDWIANQLLCEQRSNPAFQAGVAKNYCPKYNNCITGGSCLECRPTRSSNPLHA